MNIWSQSKKKFYTAYREKKINYTHQRFFSGLFFFYDSITYRKKQLHPFTAKKLHDVTIFLYPSYIFHHHPSVQKQGIEQ